MGYQPARLFSIAGGNGQMLPVVRPRQAVQGEDRTAHPQQEEDRHEHVPSDCRSCEVARQEAEPESFAAHPSDDSEYDCNTTGGESRVLDSLLSKEKVVAVAVLAAQVETWIASLSGSR